MKKYFVFLVFVIFLIGFSKATAQQYTSELRTVYVGYQLGKYYPDSAGVLAAVAKAKALQESLGGFVTVDIAPGCEIDLGDSCIVLPDSVIFNFGAGCSVSSDSDSGTFNDNEVAVYTQILGFPTITNSNGADKRIYLENASSVCEGFYWEYSAILAQDGTTAAPTATEIINTTGGTFSWSRISTGLYRGELTGDATQYKFIPSFSERYDATQNFAVGDEMLQSCLVTGGIGYIAISINNYDSALAAIDLFEDYQIYFRVYP